MTLTLLHQLHLPKFHSENGADFAIGYSFASYMPFGRLNLKTDLTLHSVSFDLRQEDFRIFTQPTLLKARGGKFGQCSVRLHFKRM